MGEMSVCVERRLGCGVKTCMSVLLCMWKMMCVEGHMDLYVCKDEEIGVVGETGG